MCGVCWREVPRDLQRAVLNTWRTYQARLHYRTSDDAAYRAAWAEARMAYQEARDAAIGSIR
jgi:hypothetical protein